MLRSRVLIIAAATAAAALPSAAPAQGGRVLSSTDGARLLAFCQGANQGGEGFCYGYITGVVDQLALAGAICVPTQFNQVFALVRGHLAAASAPDLKKHATFLVGRVLKATYPCRR